jgi:hypothetical protein
MKTISALLICACILLQAASSTVIFCGYKFNKKYISSVLCENRNIPDSCCEGQCHLKKELKEEEKNETGSLPAGKEKQEVVHYFHDNLEFSFSKSSISKNSHYYIRLDILQGFYNSVFHPPAC